MLHFHKDNNLALNLNPEHKRVKIGSAVIPEEFRKLIAEIQSAQSESGTVEVKTARGGTPKKAV